MASAALESYLLDSMAFARSSRAIVRYPTWVAGPQSPAACATRAGGDSGSNSENCDLLNAQSPGTGRGVHAGSWRVADEPGRRRQASVSRVKCEGELVGFSSF